MLKLFGKKISAIEKEIFEKKSSKIMRLVQIQKSQYLHNIKLNILKEET